MLRKSLTPSLSGFLLQFDYRMLSFEKIFYLKALILLILEIQSFLLRLLLEKGMIIWTKRKELKFLRALYDNP